MSKSSDNDGCLLIIVVLIFMVYACDKLDDIDNRTRRIEDKLNKIENCNDI